ncbi:MAG: hypothetical protein GXP24_08880 [Planctomycetes bacterium]|nr:hypothetical protein [Planctomycetota bacterium]
MASTESSNSDDGRIIAGPYAAFAAWLHRNLLWLLVGCYLLAAVLPKPGQAIRRWSPALADNQDITAPLLLLALLLFCAAAVVRWTQMRELLQRPGILLVSLIAIWLVPCLFVSALGWILPSVLGSFATSGMLVGLALVAAMPVANSSVAWCQNSKGNVGLSLGIIVLTIVLCPIVTPQLLNLMGFSLSPLETQQCEQLVKRFSSSTFIVWVIFPSFAGMMFNRLAGPAWIERLRDTLRLISAGTLLTLNYASASLAMPRIFGEEVWQTILLSTVLAMVLSMLGIASGWVTARAMSLDKPTTTALMFGFSMKHTGLALVLADYIAQQEPRVILMIVLATLLQHVVAGLTDWYFMHRAERVS